MEEKTIVAVDAMGGDNAPFEIIKGAVEAVKERENVSVLLTGQEAIIKKELETYDYPKERIAILPASQVIETGEPPVAAIKGKKDSSIVVGMKAVRKRKSGQWELWNGASGMHGMTSQTSSATTPQEKWRLRIKPSTTKRSTGREETIMPSSL